MSLHDILKNIFIEFGSGRTQGISEDVSNYFVKELDLGEGKSGFIGYTYKKKA